MTSTYAAQKRTHTQIVWKDIAQFFYLLLPSGYHQITIKNDYESPSEDIAVPVTSNDVPIKKFKEIKRNFHLMDNTLLQAGDKLGKIQQIFDELNKKLTQVGFLHNELSIDE